MFRMCDGQNPEFELRHFRHENTRNNRRKKQTPQPRHFEILTVKGPWDCWTHIVGLWDCSNDSVGLEVLLGEVKSDLGKLLMNMSLVTIAVTFGREIENFKYLFQLPLKRFGSRNNFFPDTAPKS